MDERPHTASHEEERELIEDLILQNKTLDALIKGISEDIETFKQSNNGDGSPFDVVRFTIQLNAMKSKKMRNLDAINQLVKKEHTQNHWQSLS